MGHRLADPATLVPNPDNWRLHPEAQIRIMEAALDEIGFVAPVTFNVETGRLIDGHLRVAIALARAWPHIPVKDVSVPKHLEGRAVETHDALAAMAHTDSDALIALARKADFQHQQLADFFAPQLEAQLREMTEPTIAPEPVPARAAPRKKNLSSPVLINPDDPATDWKLPLTNEQRIRLYTALDLMRDEAKTHLATSAALVALCRRYLDLKGIRLAD